MLAKNASAVAVYVEEKDKIASVAATVAFSVVVLLFCYCCRVSFLC